MNVVMRGLMAAGMGIYGTLHVVQAFTSDQEVWISLVFGLAAAIGYGLALALALLPEDRVRLAEDASLGMSVMSAVALLLTVTVGFLGIEDSLGVAQLMAFVAEGVVVLSWVLLRRSPDPALEEPARR